MHRTDRTGDIEINTVTLSSTEGVSCLVSHQLISNDYILYRGYISWIINFTFQNKIIHRKQIIYGSHLIFDSLVKF